MKKSITILVFIASLHLHAFDFGKSDLSKVVEMLGQQLTQLEHISQAIGDPSKLITAPGMQELLGVGEWKLPTQMSELWQTADGLRAMAETANGLFKKVPTSFKLLDGTVVTRNPNHYKSYDAFNQSLQNAIQLSTKNAQTIKALQLELSLVQKASLAAPTVTEVLKLSVVASGLESRINQLLLEQVISMQKPQLQALLNQSSAEARARAKAEKQTANLSSLASAFTKAFPVSENLKPLKSPN
jgi:hypothetical protein